jgi:murein L,D-transpeptidase YcbB/YkuD
LRIWFLLNCVALFAGAVLTAQTSPVVPRKSTTKQPTVIRKPGSSGMNAPRKAGPSTGSKSGVSKLGVSKSGASKSGVSKGPPKASALNQKRKTPVKTMKPVPPRHSAQLQPTPERYKEIQDALASRGYFNGSPDGTWGPKSVDALKRFQRDQNLTDDGKIGSLSLIALGLGPKRAAPADATTEKSQ